MTTSDARSKGRVLHVIQSAGLGGSESVFLALSRALHRAGWPLVFAIGEEGWLAEQLRGLGVPVQLVPGLGQGRTFELRSVLALRRVIREHRCALVHAMMFPGELYACLAARLTNRPCIANIRNAHRDLVGRRRRFVWRHVIAPVGASIVTVTEGLAAEARQVTGLTSVTCIRNGVDADAFVARGGREARRAQLGIPADAVVVGAVGNLRPVKGHGDLLRAAAMAAKKRPELRVLLVGAEVEPNASKLRRLRAELGLENQVTLLGQREDIAELLQAMDIFCLPSHSEGLSGALLQAMAAGLPVVATAVGGNPEVVEEGCSGYLVPPRRPDELAAALLRLAERPDLRQAMGGTGRARVEAEFSFPTMVERYTRLYSRLLGAEPEVASAPA